MIFKSKRLGFRHITDADFHAVRSLAIDPLVMRYIPGNTETDATTRNNFEKSLAFNKAFPEIGYFICHQLIDQKFVGSICLRFIDETPEHIMGCRIHPDFWGKGLGTEMTTTMLKHAFETLMVEKVAAIAEKENTVSIRVLEKCGLRFEKTVRYFDAKNDLVYYGITQNSYNRNTR